MIMDGPSCVVVKPMYQVKPRSSNVPGQAQVKQFTRSMPDQRRCALMVYRKERGGKKAQRIRMEKGGPGDIDGRCFTAIWGKSEAPYRVYKVGHGELLCTLASCSCTGLPTTRIHSSTTNQPQQVELSPSPHSRRDLAKTSVVHGQGVGLCMDQKVLG